MAFSGIVLNGIGRPASPRVAALLSVGFGVRLLISATRPVRGHSSRPANMIGIMARLPSALPVNYAMRPNLSVNTDAPSAALRARRGSPVTLVR